MKRVNLDTAAPAVKKFISTLPVDPEGVELALGHRVLWKLVPPTQLSEAEKTAFLAEGKSLLRRTRQRNKGVSSRVIEREIRDATLTVRGRR